MVNQIAARVKSAVILLKTPLGLVLNLLLENRVESRYGTESLSVPAPWANGVVAVVKDAV